MKFEGIKLYRASHPRLGGDVMGSGPVAVKIAKAIFRATGNGHFPAMAVSPQTDHWFCRPPALEMAVHENFDWLGHKVTVGRLVFEPGVKRVVPG
jgi:hypothetical protein